MGVLKPLLYKEYFAKIFCELLVFRKRLPWVNFAYYQVSLLLHYRSKSPYESVLDIRHGTWIRHIILDCFMSVIGGCRVLLSYHCEWCHLPSPGLQWSARHCSKRTTPCNLASVCHSARTPLYLARKSVPFCHSSAWSASTSTAKKILDLIDCAQQKLSTTRRSPAPTFTDSTWSISLRGAGSSTRMPMILARMLSLNNSCSWKRRYTITLARKCSRNSSLSAHP